MQLSIIIPVYGSPESIKELCERVSTSLRGLVDSFEIILVDDECPDDSWSEIKKTTQTLPNVIGLKLSRNFGQHKAICAGLHESKGDYCVVMDCDLQDLPEDIPTLYEKAKEGNDVVLGQRIERQDKKFKVLKSKVFYYFFNLLSGLNSDPTVANFSIISRKVVTAYLSFKEQDIDYTNVINWLGFDAVKIQKKSQIFAIFTTNFIHPLKNSSHVFFKAHPHPNGKIIVVKLYLLIVPN